MEKGLSCKLIQSPFCCFGHGKSIALRNSSWYILLSFSSSENFLHIYGLLILAYSATFSILQFALLQFEEIYISCSRDKNQATSHENSHDWEFFFLCIRWALIPLQHSLSPERTIMTNKARCFFNTIVMIFLDHFLQGGNFRFLVTLWLFKSRLFIIRCSCKNCPGWNYRAILNHTYYDHFHPQSATNGRNSSALKKLTRKQAKFPPCRDWPMCIFYWLTIVLR